MSITNNQLSIHAEGANLACHSQEISTNTTHPQTTTAWKSIAACSRPEARALLPFASAIKFRVLPLTIFNERHSYRKTLSILASNLSNKEDLRNLSPLINCDITIETCSDALLSAAIFAAYHSSSEQLAISASKAENSLDLIGERNEENEKSVSNLIDQLIAHALSIGASDIHIEPQETHCVVLYRVDGAIRRAIAKKLSQKIAPQMVRRIKILSSLDISNQSTPQEGSFKYEYQNVRCRIRSSIVPTLHGEKIALRLLYCNTLNSRPLTLNTLGLNENQRQIILSAISQNDGVITIAGPTGSGKSTLMSAILSELVADTKLIVSIEDPIEAILEGVTQVQVDDKRSRSYDSLLPVLLRQDPDVISVGETRNKTVAELVFAGGLSGHLVITSLHCSGALETPSRLINLGIDKSLLWSGLRLAVGTRLIQINCPNCIKTIESSKAISNLFRIPEATKLKLSTGCQYCSQTGILGRSALVELLPISTHLRNAFSATNAFELKHSPEAINLAKSVGFRPIMLSVRQSLLNGTISPKTALSSLGLA